MSGDPFDWHEDDAVILHEQPATAVYMNGAGDLLIRQRDTYGDEDQFIYLRPENVHRIVQALLEAAGFETATTYGKSLKLPKPESLTGAQRQKRYRDKHSNENGDGSVTESDELPLRIVANGKEVLAAE